MDYPLSRIRRDGREVYSRFNDPAVANETISDRWFHASTFWNFLTMVGYQRIMLCYRFDSTFCC
jgi:hypothetical protein